MFIRYKQWDRELTKLNNVKPVVIKNQRWLFKFENKGICDVTQKRAAEFLLKNHNYELAYEMYGLAFDDSGKELKAAIKEKPARLKPVEPKKK